MSMKKPQHRRARSAGRGSARVRHTTVALVGVGLTVGSSVLLLGPGQSSASSHREAPLIAADPQADNTDL